MDLSKEETSLLAAARRNPTAQNPVAFAVLGGLMVAVFIVELAPSPASRTWTHTSQLLSWVGIMGVLYGHAKFARAAYSLIGKLDGSYRDVVETPSILGLGGSPSPGSRP